MFCFLGFHSWIPYETFTIELYGTAYMETKKHTRVTKMMCKRCGKVVQLKAIGNKLKKEVING